MGLHKKWACTNCHRLMKAGAMSRVNEKKMAYYSAWAELLGYLASISLSVMKLDGLMREVVLATVQQAKVFKVTPFSQAMDPTHWLSTLVGD